MMRPYRGNTEKLIVIKTPKDGIYRNDPFNFEGTAEEMKQLANRHNYGGGVELMKKNKNKIVFTKL